MTTTDEGACQDLDGAGQLVVDSTHLVAVERVLAELKIKTKTVGESTAFDLTLLDLTHDGPDLKETDFDRNGTGPRVADLDAVLNEVRARFAGRCAGWVPPLGKNRPVSSMFGAYPQTKSHTLWDPLPVGKPETWLRNTGAGEGVRIGLLDTEIFGHPDIPDDKINGASKFQIAADTVPYFEQGHGVFMAGLILQQAPAVTLVARAALDSTGKASAWCMVKKLEEFYEDPAPDRVQLLVLASGCRTYDGQAPLIIERAVERLSRRMLVVAAAGNHGAMVGMSRDLQITRNSPTWPAALPAVVSVGLPTPFPQSPLPAEEKLNYSPDLPWVTCTIDPGVSGEFVSSYLKATHVKMHSGEVTGTEKKPGFDDGFASWRGTSCAAAQLGGLIAAKMAQDNTDDARKAFAALSSGDAPIAKPYEWKYREVTDPSPGATVGPNV
ncbi:MAG TPA: S8/S53 family peptidase [Lentzea sp.]